jgi:preprotein translocase subunit SecA
MIIDDNTGRILSGRRYSDGLHQAIEAKESVDLQAETQTLASITIQNYFKLYTKIAGMTGTALTEAEEFHKIYNLDVISMPTNKTLIRKDMPDYIFLTEKAKFKKIITDIKECYKKGQPVLIGTIAVETSEKLSDELSRERIPHDILNAKQHEREAEIIAGAGEKSKITIATNMAGRGTDIKLTDEAREAGGLFILGTERHESRRIDNQLRGRSGRQGDPGESRFYISLEDTLIRRFGRDSMQKAMIWGGMKEDDIIEDDMISDQIEVAQEKIEKENFESRRQLIEYDSVLNHQRIIVYSLRKAIIAGGQSLMTTIEDFFTKAIEQNIMHFAEIENCDEKDHKINPLIYTDLQEKIKFTSEEINLKEFTILISKINGSHECGKLLYNWYLKKIFPKASNEEEENSKEFQEKIHVLLEMQKWVILETLDYSWRQHIVNLDQIREGISLRSWGQKAPLIEYKHEAFLLFKRMTKNLVFEIVSKITVVNHFDIDTLMSKRKQEMNEIEELLFNKNDDEKENKKIKNKKRLKK